MNFKPMSAAIALALSCGAACAQSATHEIRLLTPETALKAAQAALADCRRRGFQVAVAVVDRGGLVQALLRDRHAGPHTPETATNKAWSAVSFRTSTLDLARVTQPGEGAAGIRNLPRVVAVGGGLMIESAGSLVGGIGVSGAPGGAEDEACARAGLAAIRDELEL